MGTRVYHGTLYGSVLTSLRIGVFVCIVMDVKNNSEFSLDYQENSEALDWLSDNISEDYAMDWPLEVDNIE